MFLRASFRRGGLPLCCTSWICKQIQAFFLVWILIFHRKNISLWLKAEPSFSSPRPKAMTVCTYRRNTNELMHLERAQPYRLTLGLAHREQEGRLQLSESMDPSKEIITTWFVFLQRAVRRRWLPPDLASLNWPHIHHTCVFSLPPFWGHPRVSEDLHYLLIFVFQLSQALHSHFLCLELKFVCVSFLLLIKIPCQKAT